MLLGSNKKYSTIFARKEKKKKMSYLKNFVKSEEPSQLSKSKLSSPPAKLDQIINNSGLQNITETIFTNMDFENLQKCQFLNKSSHQILANPMFWLKKWKGLSKKSQNDWIKAIQLTKNTPLEKNILLYIKKAIKIGHIVDVPCYISENLVEELEYTIKDWTNWTKVFGLNKEFTHLKDYFLLCMKQVIDYGEKNNLGLLQIFAPMVDNPNPQEPVDPIVPLPNEELQLLNAIELAACIENGNMIKVLAPLIENPNQSTFGVTPMHLAVLNANEDALKVLGTFTGNFNVVDGFGANLMHYSAAIYGNHDILRFLAPLMENLNSPDDYGRTPLDIAQIYENYEFITILQSYIK